MAQAIGLTQENKLDKSKSTSTYKAISTSSVTRKIKVGNLRDCVRNESSATHSLPKHYATSLSSDKCQSRIVTHLSRPLYCFLWPVFFSCQRDTDITGIEAPYAWLSMEVAQATDSLETISEIDPLEIADILGNIGGFWRQ